MHAKSPAIPYFIVLLLIAGTVMTVFWQTTEKVPYFYDEADYMYAATRGFLSNYLDRPSLSFVEVVRKGMELVRDRKQRTELSAQIRSSGDITFYRHYHGPVYAYWIAFGRAVGVQDPGTYRGSGLLIHLISTTAIFWMFRMVFTSYSAVAAFAAALTFLMNRTGLVSATVISQHAMFALVAGLTLFLMALFCRTLEQRYWYAAAAALGLGFATVETSFILLGTIVLTLPIVGYGLGWKRLWQLLLGGTFVFLATILVVWPKGILQLGVLKGYLYLAYMAVSRKAFSPIGPAELWAFKFRVYPLEFMIPAVALIACTLWWRKLANRREALPFLIYAWMFIGVTMVITIPYTHYNCSLLLASAVIVGVALGEIWLRWNLASRMVASLALAASLAGMTVLHHREVDQPPQHDYRADLLDYLGQNAGTRTVYVPFVLVPTIHFYHPEVATIGYDMDWQGEALASALSKAGPNGEILCTQAVCSEVRAQIRGPVKQTQVTAGGVPVRGQSIELDVLYALTIAPP